MISCPFHFFHRICRYLYYFDLREESVIFIAIETVVDEVKSSF